MRMGKYNEALRQAAYESLNDSQRTFLDDYVKRGRKTKWLNILAAYKGIVIPETDDLSSLDETQAALLKWELIEVEDAGTVSKDLRCECGKALRYRYTVRHSESGVMYHLGSEHLEQYTNLDAETVRAVVKGLKRIDLERDELLDKVLDQWAMPLKLHPKLPIPKDVAEQLALGLPLLERQLKLLKQQNAVFIKDMKAYEKQLAEDLAQEAKMREAQAKAEEFERIQAMLPPFDKLYYEKLNLQLELGSLSAEEAKMLLNMVTYQREAMGQAGLSLSALAKRILDHLGRYGSSKLAVRGLLYDMLNELGNQS